MLFRSVLDHETDEAIELRPDAAGRATTFSDGVGFHATVDLTRDRQGRPARDQYDPEGRRVATPGADTLTYDGVGLVAHHTAGARTRTFAPALPGLQLSRLDDGRWEAALLAPNDSPLLVLDAAAGHRLEALYTPTGEEIGRAHV